MSLTSSFKNQSILHDRNPLHLGTFRHSHGNTETTPGSPVLHPANRETFHGPSNWHQKNPVRIWPLKKRTEQNAQLKNPKFVQNSNLTRESHLLRAFAKKHRPLANPYGKTMSRYSHRSLYQWHHKASFGPIRQQHSRDNKRNGP